MLGKKCYKITSRMIVAIFTAFGLSVPGVATSSPILVDPPVSSELAELTQDFPPQPPSIKWLTESGNVDPELDLDPNINPTRIIGKDERREITKTPKLPYSAVVFMHNFPIGGCSGAMVGPDTVLTAAHCIVDNVRDRSLITSYRYCPGAYRLNWWDSIVGTSEVTDEGSGALDSKIKPQSGITDITFGYTAPYGCARGDKYFVDPRYWDHPNSAEYDFALVQLAADLGDRSGFFGYSSRDVNVKDLPLRSAGYPGDKRRGTLWTDYTYAVKTNERSYSYKIDTVGGQSGSPLYNDDNYIHGVHHGFSSGDPGYNQGARLTPTRHSWITHYARNNGWG